MSDVLADTIPNTEQSAATQSRTLVLCFDGTSSQYDSTNTNVVKLFALLKRDVPEQMCYYQPGVGTYFNPGVVSPLFHWGAKILDEAIAWYLNEHVMEGYEFIMQNYHSGDKICIFGFSRGAYTARALAGFLYKIGLLPKDNQAQVPFAYRFYQRTDAEGLVLCAGFKKTYCRDVKIEFLGVWETVASVGIILSRDLPFTNSNLAIKTFRHALALDECRAKFRPNLFHRASLNERISAISTSACSSSTEGNLAAGEGIYRVESSDIKGKMKQKRSSVRSIFGRKNISTLPVIVEGEDESNDVMEVWFPGWHSDVSGGVVRNDTPSSLADISLRWMVREIIASGCGVQFDLAALARANIEYTADVTREQQALDKICSRQPLYDQLKLQKLWWILEVLPLTHRYQDAQGVWHTEWNMHLGRGRRIVDAHPNFHISVKERMQNASLKYTPKAIWAKGSEVYVQ